MDYAPDVTETAPLPEATDDPAQDKPETTARVWDPQLKCGTCSRWCFLHRLQILCPREGAECQIC